MKSESMGFISLLKKSRDFFNNKILIKGGLNKINSVIVRDGNMKTAEDIKKLRETSSRLKELGLPEVTLEKIDSWIDKEEAKISQEKRTCPSGHTLPVDQFRSYVDLEKEEVDDAITFSCPGGKRGHDFSLRRGIASGMFTEEEAEKLRRVALVTKEAAER